MDIKTETKDIVCSVCGGTVKQRFIIDNIPPTGSPDLDLRPAEPHRSFIRFWVSECPDCGYCETKVDMPIDFDRSYLDSEEYKSCGGRPAAQGLTAQFLRQALVREHNHNYPAALQSYVYAAWSCDDSGDTALAAECRAAAVKLMDDNPAAFKGQDDLAVLRADLLRRSGSFDRLISEYKDRKFGAQLMNVIVGYELTLAEKQDSSVHLASEIPNVMIK